MKQINIETWERKEHFQFFLNSDVPFYNINFTIDITGLKEKTKLDSISINNALIYFTVKTLNQVKNFLYRLENGNVIEYERIDPSFTCLRKGEDLFRLITVEYNESIVQFDKDAKTAISNSTRFFDISLLSKRKNFVFISILPWIPFTGIDHSFNLNKEDAIPRISWGKFYEQNQKTLLPFNIQVNHIFIDGIHIGKFYELLQKEIYNYSGTLPATT